MNLQALGINHKTAPLALREKIYFDPETTPLALQELTQIKAINEAVILSTCHRTEIYSHSLDVNALTHWLAEKHALNTQALTPHLYHHQNENMVRHLMRVACGLDSIVIGEPQIFGQIKTAFGLAQQQGTVGKYLTKLFPAVFNAGKAVRTQTAIGAHPISIAYAIVSLAQRIFSACNHCQILLIGAGEIMEGDLDQVIEPLMHEHQNEQLAEM